MVNDAVEPIAYAQSNEHQSWQVLLNQSSTEGVHQIGYDSESWFHEDRSLGVSEVYCCAMALESPSAQDESVEGSSSVASLLWTIFVH